VSRPDRVGAVPDGFVGRYAYAPPGGVHGEPWIVALLDRRYVTAGAILSGCGTILLVASVALRWGLGAVAAGLLCGLVGVGVRMFGGRAGFYELASDGTLGGAARPGPTGYHRVASRAIRGGVVGA
jgi:hypothetical protein